MINDSNKLKLEELTWLRLRTQTQIKLQEKLSNLLPNESYSFLSFEESDNIQLLQDEWPKRKWEDHLYYQTDTSNKGAIERIIRSYVEFNESPNVHLFFLNYNSCLISILDEVLLAHWKELLELDGDEIFISIPSKTHFICVELTEDLIVGQEKDGRSWIYEITFSNKKLANSLS